MDFLKSCLIFYIAVISYTTACTISYDETNAQQLCILTCTDYITNTGRNYNEYGHYRKNICRMPIYGENRLYISELIYKIGEDTFVEGSIPLTQGYNTQYMLDAINSLNLSDNGFSNTPSITSMKNLKLINMSRNNLTTAILSNINELGMLTDIDFSYNIITDVQVYNFQHVYHKLTKLNISHNHLVTIPDAIFDGFRDLQTLDLSFNYIESLSIVTFEGLKKISTLDLSINRISSINTSLFWFSELNFLNISGNQIENLDSNDFKQLSMLRTLDLSFNFLKVVYVNIFKNTIMLETLDLSNNVLQIIEPDAFSSLLLLSSIDLSKNKLKSLPIDLFKHTNIFYFSITDNKFEGSIIKGMFEGINVTKLDFSYQFLTEIKDYAFQNLNNLNELFLNSNNITILSSNCLNSLVNLKQLDLSNNQITSIDFDKKDLTNLVSLRLKNNRITEIKFEDLASLYSLQFLDISHNQISHLTSNLFKSLKYLINLEIYSNPFVGTIESGAFEGLVLLPSLDMSHNMLSAIQNASFSDMLNLKEVNITHCEISELQYNVFIYTGSIKILDLSYNKLTDFFVNATELGTLSKLFLNNNLIKTISSTSLSGMSRLNEINLSHNVIENMPSVVSLIHLQHFDFSYNEQFNFSVSMLRETYSPYTFILSGIRTEISFEYIIDNSSMAELIISNASISNITQLYLNKMVNLASLDISFNKVSKLQLGAFNALSSLNSLNLAFNKISFIQPGVFKDNAFLDILNISHNCISSVSYGIFRGLNSLKILDMSFNKIKDLQSERFYEVKHLTQLVVDFNQIETINSEEFADTSLSKLSIGNNPIDCQVLVKLKMKGPFEITAIRLDEHSNENVNGVICNNVRTTKPTLLANNNGDDYSILNSLRNILKDFNDENIKQEAKDNKYLEKISNSLEKVLIINNNTNVMLSILIKSLEQTTATAVFTTAVTPVTAVTRETTYTPTQEYISNITQTLDIISNISQINKELENAIAFQKQNIISEIESKFISNSNQSVFLPTNIDHRKLNNKVPTFLFIETYVALTLSVALVSTLVGLLLYRFYKSRSRGTFSMSNHMLPGAMDDSRL